MTKPKRALLGAAILGAAGIAGQGGAHAASLEEALKASKPILELRARYEGVDQANLARDADAFTFRTRAGLETGDWNGLKALVEFEDVRAIGHYNSTTNGRTAYPVVADPEVTELNRAQLSWRASPAFAVTLGRQLIVLDDQRFVGAVAWRDDEQTFDAVRADFTAGKLKATGAWIGNVNRVFGEAADWSSDSWIVNAAYAGPAAFKPAAFVYALDFAKAPANSSLTWGARATGAAKTGGVGLSYAVSYAHQSDYGKAPTRFSLDYWSAEAGAAYRQFGVKASYESLEGDGKRGFSTPLATLHAFQGWADVFLTTPADGVRDAYLTLTWKPGVGPFPNMQFTGVAHDFKAQRGGADLGSEIDLQLAVPLNPRLTATAKYADYDGVPGFADRRKIWLGLDFKL